MRAAAVLLRPSSLVVLLALALAATPPDEGGPEEVAGQGGYRAASWFQALTGGGSDESKPSPAPAAAGRDEATAATTTTTTTVPGPKERLEGSVLDAVAARFETEVFRQLAHLLPMAPHTLRARLASLQAAVLHDVNARAVTFAEAARLHDACKARLEALGQPLVWEPNEQHLRTLAATVVAGHHARLLALCQAVTQRNTTQRVYFSALHEPYRQLIQPLLARSQPEESHVPSLAKTVADRVLARDWGQADTDAAHAALETCLRAFNQQSREQSSSMGAAVVMALVVVLPSALLLCRAVC